MEIRHLKYFLEVCACHNMTRAAETLHVSQQTISKQMRELETELGVPLFIRQLNGVQLTEYAESLVKPAKEILEKVEETQSMLKKMRAETPVSIRLGFVRGDFNSRCALSPKMIFEWEKRFPQMTLEIQEHNPDDLDRLLEQKELDLVYSSCISSQNFCRILVESEPAYLLISRDNPISQLKNVTAEDLTDQCFLISRLHPIPAEERKILAERLGFKPEFRTFNGSFEQGTEHARANEGILIAGRAYCLSRNLDGLTAIPFPDQGYVFRHYLAYRKELESLPSVYDLIQICRKISRAPGD